MCTVCGCSDGASVNGQTAGENHHHHGHNHGAGYDQHGAHDHDGAHAHHHGGHDHHHYGRGEAGVHVTGMSQQRLIEIETSILAKNDGYATSNRRVLNALGSFAVNLVSSPGSGKTTLLCRTIGMLEGQPLAVIEGDQQTQNDADRIRATGARAIQVNTGKGCHLDGHMVGHAMDALKLAPGSMLFIENVGNLVCPAAFDLGAETRDDRT